MLTFTRRGTAVPNSSSGTHPHLVPDNHKASVAAVASRIGKGGIPNVHRPIRWVVQRTAINSYKTNRDRQAGKHRTESSDEDGQKEWAAKD